MFYSSFDVSCNLSHKQFAEIYAAHTVSCYSKACQQVQFLLPVVWRGVVLFFIKAKSICTSVFENDLVSKVANKYFQIMVRT